MRFPANPGWVSLSAVVGTSRPSWLRAPGAVPITPGWGPLAAVVCGLWCVVCGVWCAAVVCWWGCGWCVLWLVPRHSWRRFLCATPRHSWLGIAAGGAERSSPLLAEGPGRVFSATPGWVSLSAVVGAPRHSWLRAPGAVPHHSWLGSAGGGGVWCVVCGVWCVMCGGGVLVGLWLVCGVVGPSLLLAEVPVWYSPPLLAGFRCRWWWTFLAIPG